MKTNIDSLADHLGKPGFADNDLILAISDKTDGQLKFVSGKREEVLANRERFFEKIGIAGKGILVRANQVHGNRVYRVDDDDIKPGPNRFSREVEIKNTDGLVTDLKEVWLAITVADCNPILIWSRDGKIVSAVHAGWQGTLIEIARKTVEKIAKEYPIKASELSAWIGPSIGKDDFEVKDDVWQPFRKRFFDSISGAFIEKNSKKYIDLKLINSYQLILAGMVEKNIIIDQTSTLASDKYFSYRAGDEGRMMVIIGKN